MSSAGKRCKEELPDICLKENRNRIKKKQPATRSKARPYRRPRRKI